MRQGWRGIRAEDTEASVMNRVAGNFLWPFSSPFPSFQFGIDLCRNKCLTSQSILVSFWYLHFLFYNDEPSCRPYLTKASAAVVIYLSFQTDYLNLFNCLHFIWSRLKRSYWPLLDLRLVLSTDPLLWVTFPTSSSRLAAYYDEQNTIKCRSKMTNKLVRLPENCRESNLA